MLYHTTSPESAVSILKNGFEDRRGKPPRGKFGARKPPGIPMLGVWAGKLPAVNFVRVDPYLGNREERYLAIDIPREVYKPFKVEDPTWPYPQFFFRAEFINRYPIREISLAEVLHIRIKADPDFIDRLISLLKNSNEYFVWSFGKMIMLREYHPPSSDYAKAVDHAITWRDRYLQLLRVISDAAPHKYDRIKELVGEVFSMA